MSKRWMLLAALCAGLACVIGCSEDDDGPSGPVVTTEEWQGAIHDPVLAAAMTGMGLTYDSTRFVYTIASDGEYAEEVNVGFGWSTVEVGTWTLATDTYTFTPVSDSAYNQQTFQMEATTTKAPYTGVLTDATTMTVANYINIDDQRSLGTLTLIKQ